MPHQVGDTVIRLLAGAIEMPLKVTAVTDEKIDCGPWTFCARTGAEIDNDLNWGPPPKMTGSFLRMKDGEIEIKVKGDDMPMATK